MEQRRSPRYSINLDALILPQSGEPWLCQISDFCQEGMLLIAKDLPASPFPLPVFGHQEQVDIHLGVPDDEQVRHFNIEGKVVRALSSGVGINFSSGIDNNLLDALLFYSGIDPIEDDELEDVGQETAAFETNFKRINSLGRYPRTRYSQASILERSGLVQSGNHNVAELKHLVSELRQLVGRIIPEMMSVFFEYMDDELLETAKKAETSSEQAEIFTAMTDLKTRREDISRIFSREILSKVDDPRDMSSLLKDYHRLMARKEMGRRLSDEDSISGTKEFEHWLALANVIEHGQKVYQNQLQKIQTRLGSLVESWSYNEGNPLGIFVFCHAFGNAVRSIEVNEALQEDIYSGLEKAILPMMRKLYLSSLKSIEDSGIFPDPDVADKKLTSLEEKLEMKSSVASDTTDVVSEPGNDLENQDSAISNKRNNAGSHAERFLDLVDLIEELAGDSSASSLPFSGNSRVWISSLKDISLEVAPILAEENPQDALAVIDQLVVLGEVESSIVKALVDQVIDDILGSHDSNSQNDSRVFVEAQEKLSPLVEKQNQLYNTNIQRTLRASEGQQALHEAQTSLMLEMSHFLVGKTVPELFLKLLVPGWRNLLISTHLRKGKDSQEWSRYLRVLHQVFSYLNPGQNPSLSSGYMTPLKLIDEVELGLGSIAYESGESAPLLKSLHQMFTQRQFGNDNVLAEVPVVDINAGNLARILGFGDIEESRTKREQLLSLYLSEPEWKKCFDCVEKMLEGDQIEILNARDERNVATLAWSSSDKSSMVFVDSRGIKSHELSIEDLANKVYEGMATLTEDSGLSVSLKAIQNILDKRHKQLLLKAEHIASETLLENLQSASAVAEIDGILEKNLIQLQCQKIVSINAKADELAPSDILFYEIVLSLLDSGSDRILTEDFISLAEANGRMGMIDRWTLEKTFRWISEADREGKLKPDSFFLIKLSADSMAEENFMQFVLQQFSATKMPTSRVCFQVKMSSISQSLTNTVSFMECLKPLGVRFSLDDCGSDPAFFSCLRKIPADYVKIDGNFIGDIVANKKHYAVVKSINDSSRLLGVKTIAACAKDERALKILKETGVDYVQMPGSDMNIPID